MTFAEEFLADLKVFGVPENPDPDEIKSLVEEYHYRSSARDELIILLLYPAFNIARRYKRRANASDILGEALLALVECVERWPSVSEDDDIKRYVEFSIRKRVKDFIDNDKVLVTPSRRIRDGAELINVFGLSPEDEERARHSVPDTSLDVRDSIRDKVDQQIIEGRINGRPVKEIAAEIGQDWRWVYKRLRDLERTCTG